MRLHILLLLLSAAFVSTWDGGKYQPQSINPRAQASAAASTGAQVPATLQEASPQKSEAKTAEQQPQSAQQPKPFMSHAEWIMAGLTAVYVLLTGFYVRYSRKTLTELQRQIGLIEKQDIATQKQIDIAQTSADAALQNAKAAVAASRPFVMIEAERSGNFVTFRAINYGNSPAKITFQNPVTKFKALPIGEKLPDIPNYGSLYENDQATVINVQWIAPMKHMDVGSFDIGIFRDHDTATHKALIEGQKLLYIYSAVKYRGIFEDTIYRSTFCYMAVNGGLRMAGPYGYNEYT